MLIKPLYRDPITGYWLEAQDGDSLNVPLLGIYNEYVTLFADAQANTCCGLINYTAMPLNSVSLPGALLRNTPSVDCIILEDGVEGQSVLAAITHGKLYSTPTEIDYTTSDTLYLGQDCKLTTNPPSLDNGDNWLIEVGTLVNHNAFIFYPKVPVDLNNPGGGSSGDLPNPVGNTGRSLVSNGTTFVFKQLTQADIAPNAAISSFNSSQTSFEVGQTVSNPQFNAAYNEDVNSAQLKDSKNNLWQDLDNVYSFNSSYTFTLNTPGSVTFTLEATLSGVVDASLNLTWYYKKYYGTSINLTDIANLQYNSLASSRTGSFSVNANPGEYIYFAIPVSFGNPSFSVGGFSGGFTLVDTVSFINMYGVAAMYNIYRSDNYSLGNIMVSIS